MLQKKIVPKSLNFLLLINLISLCDVTPEYNIVLGFTEYAYLLGNIGLPCSTGARATWREK